MANASHRRGRGNASAQVKRDRGRQRPRKQTALRLNPEVLRGVDPELLRGLDDVRVVVIQPASFLARWTEGVVIHVVGTGIVAVVAFGAGMILTWFIA